MVKQYTKSDQGKHLLVEETVTKTEKRQFTPQEIDEVIADLEARLATFKNYKQKAVDLEVVGATAEIVTP